MRAINSFKDKIKLFLGGSNLSCLFFTALLLAWAFINIGQSLLTDIIRDEAYYFFYSVNLAWGYFDHPPMVALSIKLSSLFFDNELSVRFLTILLQLFTLIIIWKIIDHKSALNKDLLAFMGISFSVVMFTVYGFVTTPDSPLLFFTALFLLAYKKFLQDDSLLNSFILSLAMAGLVYSKYQGGLVIIFVVLSNLRLLLNYRFWLSGLFALFLLTPHIYWQVENGFPSFVYHTIGRAKPFKISYFLEYLPNQAASFNPFVFTGALYILYKHKTKNLFEKSLRYVSLGMILFFWVMTFRGHSQPQWTIAASIPFIILIYNYRNKSLFISRLLNYTIYPSIILIVIIRLILIYDSFPVQLEFHNQSKWAGRVREIAGDKPVIFRDGYQNPSLYRFYTGKEATTVNSVYYRQNQYDLYDFNSKFMGNPAMIVTDVNDTTATPYLLTDKDTIYVRFTDSLILTSEIIMRCNIPDIKDDRKLNNLQLTIKNTSEQVIPFNHSDYPVSLHFVLTGKGRRFSIPFENYELPDRLGAGDSLSLTTSLSLPPTIPKGVYNYVISVKCGPFREGFNSIPAKITIR